MQLVDSDRTFELFPNGHRQFLTPRALQTMKEQGLANDPKFVKMRDFAKFVRGEGDGETMQATEVVKNWPVGFTFLYTKAFFTV